jgi:hypothetical protein
MNLAECLNRNVFDTSLSEGKVTPEMKDILKMTDRLKAELPQMLDEHKAIIDALKILIDAATKEKKMEYVHFADRIIQLNK